MVDQVVVPAQRHQVGQVGLATLGPGRDVVDFAHVRADAAAKAKPDSPGVEVQIARVRGDYPPRWFSLWD